LPPQKKLFDPHRLFTLKVQSIECKQSVVSASRTRQIQSLRSPPPPANKLKFQKKMQFEKHFYNKNSLRCTTMFNLTTPKVATVAALALTVMTTLPSFAWGWHPRRAEVLGRDAHLNREINRDYGHLNGHYGQLKAEDRSIRRQEQRDFRRNGGFLTRGQQAHLNREENHVQRQINHDL
jgi:hypothetical protein